MDIIKDKNWYKVLFLLLIFLLGFYEYNSISSTFNYLAGVDKIAHDSFEKIHLFIFTSLSLFVFILSPDILKKERNNKVVQYFVTFLTIFIATNFLHVLISNYRAGAMIEYVSWFSPLFVFLAIYVITYRMKDPDFQTWCFVILNLILVYGYYRFFQYIYLLINEDQVQLMSYYFSLYFLPLAMCINQKKIKYLLMAVLIVAAVTAGKRTGAVALFLGIIIHLIINTYAASNSRKKTIRLAFVVVVLISSYLIISWLLENSDLFLFQRLSIVGEDNGSGRTKWYGNVLSETLNMDWGYYLIGHGYKGVLRFLHGGKGADSDFLEIPYDYGIFGTIIYWAFIISLISYTVHLTKKHSFYAAPFGMSVALYMVGSTLSHIIVYPYFIIVFALTWGYIIACRRLEIEGRISNYLKCEINLKNRNRFYCQIKL